MFRSSHTNVRTSGALEKVLARHYQQLVEISCHSLTLTSDQQLLLTTVLTNKQ